MSVTLDPASTAVVLIEFQNDFTTDGGALHGAVAGVMARTDVQRGVWKAPAGIEATLGVAGLSQSLTDGDNGDLNPLGINCLRNFPVYGTVVWGSRTLDGNLQAGEPGLGLIIAKTLAPVVPMRIFGAREALPRGGGRLRLVPITIVIGERQVVGIGTDTQRTRRTCSGGFRRQRPLRRSRERGRRRDSEDNRVLHGSANT